MNPQRDMAGLFAIFFSSAGAPLSERWDIFRRRKSDHDSRVKPGAKAEEIR